MFPSCKSPSCQSVASAATSATVMTTTTTTVTTPSTSKPRRTYRHEPYAAGVIVPADVNDTTVCFVPRSPARRSQSSGSSYTSLPRSTAIPTPCTSVSAAFPVSSVIPSNTAVMVSFKYGKKPFQAPFPLQAGDLVVVEGDRGVDMGVVECCASPASTQRAMRILRLATLEDKAMHVARAEKERDALFLMRDLAKQVDCHARIEDVMFQLDGKKITAVISRDTRSFVDFRRLQRAAFDVYRCRVWFCYMDEIEETMSTETSRPLRRSTHRKSSNEPGAKKTRNISPSVVEAACA